MAATVSGDPRAETEAISLADAPAEAPQCRQDTLRYVARQPILDGRGKLHGYELLFRCGPAASAFCGDGDTATRMILDNTLLFGLERLAGGMPAFVNCTQEALEKRLVMVLPPQKTVLELLETLDPTPVLLEACKELKAHGFKLALDDFEWKPEWAPFIPLADYIKVDLSITTAAHRGELMRHIRDRKVKLIAERVETQPELEMAQKEGFTLFQGYYFCRPVLMQNRAVPSNRLVHLQLLQALHARPLDTLSLTTLVKRDAALTYRLLLMVNSPLFGTSMEIRSIHQALVLIGDEMFRRVALLAIAGELRGGNSSELLRMAYSRGRFCELAAAATGQDATEQYLLGMLSLLPAMLRVPMEALVKELPLRPPMRAALLGKPVPERAVLGWLAVYESGNWESCDAIAAAAGLPTGNWPRLYAEALEWAEANLSLAI